MSDFNPSIASEHEFREHITSLAKTYTNRFHSKQDFEPGISPVPVSGKVLDSEEMSNLVNSCLDFWLTEGRFNETFSKKMADFVGRKYFLTCNSGSSANLLAVSALTSPLLEENALKPNDEVITCATGFPTTINPIITNKLVPVFVDVDLPTYNIDVLSLEAAITPKTKAIVIAHTLGNPFNLGKVVELAKRHGLFLVEDTCDALGATYDNKLVGTFGDVSTLSFYPAHHITTGEGGAVYCDNSRIKRAAESLRDWGRDCWCAPGKDNTCKKRYGWCLGELPSGFDHKYIYSHLGYNLKMTDMQAAIGIAQLAKAQSFIEARRRNFSLLSDALEALHEYIILPKATPNSNPSWFGFPISIRQDSHYKRNDLVQHLNAFNIGTRLLFGGNLLKQPYMRDVKYKVVGNLSNSDFVMQNSFWVGVYPGLTEAHISYIADKIKAFFHN
jgi:CDP-6-deoxy-D-xylo-4-hexulose-3-dehydrase